jgi:hypothetical protein
MWVICSTKTRIKKLGIVQLCSTSLSRPDYNPDMNSPIRIVSVQKDEDDGVFVTFSDGTATGYVVEELVELRPIRERNTVSPLPKPSQFLGLYTHSVRAPLMS